MHKCRESVQGADTCRDLGVEGRTSEGFAQFERFPAWFFEVMFMGGPGFLGGTHEMPAGEAAYFMVDLTPGRYAWIAEVSDPLEKGMLVTFSVE